MTRKNKKQLHSPPATDTIPLNIEIIDQIIPDIGYTVYRECTPDWKIKDKQKIYDGWDMTYAVKGVACYSINGVPHELKAGDLLCLPPGNKRAAKTSEDNLMHCFAVNFKLKNHDINQPAVIPLPLISHIGIREDIMQIFHDLIFTWINHQPLYKVKVHGLFMLLLHRFMETAIYATNSTVNDTRIRKVLRHISSHFSDKITVKNMASLCNLNTVYFGTLFKQETGMSMLQYLTKTRIKYAENLLRSGGFRVHEAAERCGFSDINHFYRHFKHICGFAPSDCIPKKTGV